MDKQTRDARQMAKELPFRLKIKHFFEYYKWHVIVPLVILIAVGTTIYQNVTREKYDIDISYYGGFSVTDEQITQIDKYFSEYIDDIDQDEKKETTIHSTVSNSSDFEYQMAVANKFMAELSAGTYFCYLFSEEFYNTALSYEIEFEKVADLRENPTLSTILGTTENPTYLCVRKLYDRELNDEKKVAAHNNALLLLDGILQENNND